MPHVPTINMRRAAVHRHHSHITSSARGRTTCSTWTLVIHTRQSRCDYPHILLSGPLPRGFPFHTPAIIVPDFACAHSHVLIYTLISNYLFIPSSGGAHIHWNSAGANGGKRYYRARLAMPAWILRDIVQLQGCGCFIANACAKCRCRGSIRAGSSSFCARQRRIGSTFDAEWQRYPCLIFVRIYTNLVVIQESSNHSPNCQRAAVVVRR